LSIINNAEKKEFDAKFVVHPYDVSALIAARTIRQDTQIHRMNDIIEPLFIAQSHR